jgi:hypothetical protein
MCDDNPNCGCSMAVGHPIVVWPGWGVNPARWSAADINPLPIQPLHYGNFTATQTQLLNGLQLSNFGKRAAYDDYLRLVDSSSANAGNKGMKQLQPGFKPAGARQPSAKQLQQMIQQNAPSTSPDPTGGVGIFANGVPVRNYYG